jgi:dihydropteroate synthase
MPRKHYEWKLRDKTLQLGERTLVMGILNVTPDSFSDGGKYADPDRAFARALELEEEGADIIDIGAESTRPGSARISEAEELRRLVPVLKRLQGRLTIPISVDTYKSGVATKALELGVDIINDPTGLTWDPELAKAVVQVNGGLILNHMRGTPETWTKLPPLKDPLATIVMELDSAMHRAVRAGVERKCIMVDPGLGFGKRKEQNAEILARLGEMGGLDLPILVGASRKHFLSKETEVETEFASAAAVAAAILYGAHIVRVHDLKAMKSVVQVADEIARARSEHEELERARAAAKKEEAKAGVLDPPAWVRARLDPRIPGQILRGRTIPDKIPAAAMQDSRTCGRRRRHSATTTAVIRASLRRLAMPIPARCGSRCVRRRGEPCRG